VRHEKGPRAVRGSGPCRRLAACTVGLGVRHARCSQPWRPCCVAAGPLNLNPAAPTRRRAHTPAPDPRLAFAPPEAIEDYFDEHIERHGPACCAAFNRQGTLLAGARGGDWRGRGAAGRASRPAASAPQPLARWGRRRPSATSKPGLKPAPHPSPTPRQSNPTPTQTQPQPAPTRATFLSGTLRRAASRRSSARAQPLTAPPTQRGPPPPTATSSGRWRRRTVRQRR
jgi:hypothetical protein